MTARGVRRVVLAPNAFKGTFDAVELAGIWREALADRQDLEIDVRPISDGGDGFVPVVRHYRPAAIEVRLKVRDPRGRPLEAPWAWDPDADVAWIESAAAIGARLLAPDERDPLEVDSTGLGQLVRGVARLGARTIVVGLGGSATVDGGWGMARTLGFRFVTDDDAAVERPADLERLARIVPPDAPPVSGVAIVALADVANPLLGPRGAAPVFGPQKGAGDDAVRRLARGLERMAERWVEDLGAPADLPARAGAGAAGGLGAALVAFLGARLERGPDWVGRLAGLAAAVTAADGVVTGEGRFDEQSAADKGTGYVLDLARSAGRPAVVVCGEAASAPEGSGVDILDAGALDGPDGRDLDAGDLARLAARAVDRLAELPAGRA